MNKKVISILSLFIYILLELSYVCNFILNDITRHLIAFPFLILAIFTSTGKLSLYNYKLSILGGIIYFILFNFQNRPLSVFGLINIFFITSLLSVAYRRINIKYGKSFIYIGIFFYLLNIVVSYFEYKNNVNLFYFDMNEKWDVKNAYFRFRASGIWGHPLYTALIHGACMIFILMSSINKKMKFILWFTGLFALFFYDARAATIMTILASFTYLYLNGDLNKKNIISILILFIVIILSLNFISKSDLGGKLFDVQTKDFNDESSNARIVAFQVFFDLDMQKLLLGVADQFDYVQKHYNVICAENAFIGLTLVCGFPLALLIFTLQIKNLWNIMKSKKIKYRYLIFAYLFATGLFNQALTTPTVWITFMMFYILFCFNSENQIKNENRYNDIPRIR